MDKIKINNQVVDMRKFVKQGKIRVINKFVKEIQLLRNRKGGEQKVAKSKRKVDRLLEEVALLKKIKPDTVSRLALSKAKDWKAVLAQKETSLEDRCHALLASYGPVQAAVEKFYSENSYLTLKIPTLINEWEEKNTTLTPQKNNNSFKPKGKSGKIPSISPKEGELVVGKHQMQSLDPNIESASKELSKDNVHGSSAELSDSENMPDSDSEDEDKKGIVKGNLCVSDRNQEGRGGIEEDNDGIEEDSDDIEEDSDGAEEDSGDIEEESEDEDTDDDSGMHHDSNSDDDEREEKKNDLRDKSKTLSTKKSDTKFKQTKNNLNIPPKSPVKTANDLKNKIPSLQKNVPLDSSSAKAVALVNLNELMDMDEIPIESSKTDEGLADDCKKRKKDSFFLKDGEEEFSESDQSDEDSNNDDEVEQGPFNHKNVRSNSFNKRQTPNNQGRGKWEEKSPKMSKHFPSNVSQGKKFEKSDHQFKRDFHSKPKFNKFDRNNRKPYPDQQEFRKNKRNSENESKWDSGKGSPMGMKFEKGDRRFKQDFPSKPKFNKFDRNNGKTYTDKQDVRKNKWNSGNESKWNSGEGSKPFNSFQEKKQMFGKNKPDTHPRNNTFGKTVKKDEPPLHPSWEAKRKLKQATSTKFQGKRMVFDD